MAYKDIVNKAMFSDPIIMADLFNVIYFEGNEVIDPHRIIYYTTDFCKYQKENNQYVVRKRESDVCTLYYQGKELPLIVLCIEN